MNEGGGGDNLAVAWSLPADGPSEVEPGGLPISGDYLSPFFSVLDGAPSPILTSTGPSGAAVARYGEHFGDVQEPWSGLYGCIG